MNMRFSIEKTMNIFLKGGKKLLSIGIILAAAVLTLISYGVQARNIETMRARNSAEAKKNEALKEIAQSEKSIKLYKNIFSKKDASTVINAVNNIAKDSKVRVISIKPGNEENQPLYIKTPFTLVIEADAYHAIGKFISKIENQPEIYFIDAISIRHKKDSQLSNNLIFDVTLSIIVFKG